MVDRKIHLGWHLTLERRAKKGDVVAKQMLEEGKNPGDYFDGPTHFYDVVRVVRELTKKPDVKAVGIFGSRLRHKHVALKSDIDVFVIDDSPITYGWTPSRGPTASRDTYRFTGIANNINIQECSSADWNQVAADPNSVYFVALEIMRSVRWLWIRQDYVIADIPEGSTSR